MSPCDMQFQICKALPSLLFWQRGAMQFEEWEREAREGQAAKLYSKVLCCFAPCKVSGGVSNLEISPSNLLNTQANVSL